EAVVARAVDPSARVRRELLAADADGQALVARLLLGQPDPPHLGLGERRPGDPVVAAVGLLLAEDVGGEDPGLPDGDVGEGGLAGDVADREYAVGRPHV